MTTPVSLQLLDLLDHLQSKCAEAEGNLAARKWREAITGVCLDQTTKQAICVEIDGVQHLEHWLIDWINTRLTLV